MAKRKPGAAVAPPRIVEAALTIVGNTEVKPHPAYGEMIGPAFEEHARWRAGLQRAAEGNRRKQEKAAEDHARWGARAAELAKTGINKKWVARAIADEEHRAKGNEAASYATIYKHIHLKK